MTQCWAIPPKRAKLALRPGLGGVWGPDPVPGRRGVGSGATEHGHVLEDGSHGCCTDGVEGAAARPYQAFPTFSQAEPRKERCQCAIPCALGPVQVDSFLQGDKFPGAYFFSV